MRIREKFRKVAALVVTMSAMTSMYAMTTFAAEDTITVSLRIEGTDNSIYYQTLEVSKQSSVEELVREADNKSNAITVTMGAGYGGGYYVSGINSLSEASYGGYDGWNYIVNDTTPSVGISDYKLKDGDSVVLYYADTITAGIQYPVADLSGVNEGVIKFTSTDTVYDQNWNPTTSVNPVAGATVTWYYGNTSAKYVTGSDGSIQIDPSQLTAGDHRLQIDKNNDKGLPVVLRYAPDYKVNVKGATPTGDGSAPEMYIWVAAVVIMTGSYALISNKRKKEC